MERLSVVPGEISCSAWLFFAQPDQGAASLIIDRARASPVAPPGRHQGTQLAAAPLIESQPAPDGGRRHPGAMRAGDMPVLLTFLIDEFAPKRNRATSVRKASSSMGVLLGMGYQSRVIRV